MTPMLHRGTLQHLRWADAVPGPILVGLLYYAAAEAAFAIGTLTPVFAPFWPPNVVLLVMCLRLRAIQWLPCLLAAYAAHLLAEAPAGMSVLQLYASFGCNAALAALTATILKLVRSGPPWLADLQRAAAYLLIAVLLCPALVAFAAGYEPVAGGGDPRLYWDYWWRWYLSNAFGNLTLTPAVLAWWPGSRAADRREMPSRPMEAAALTLGLAATCSLAFGVRAGWTGAQEFFPALLYMPIPLLLWAAVRFGVRGGTGAILVVTLLALGETTRGMGMLAGATPEDSVFALQILLSIIAVPVLLLAALADQLLATHERLSRSEAQFRAMAETVPEILFTTFADGGCEYMSPRFYQHTGLPPGAALGFGWTAALDPNDRERLMAAHRHAAESDGGFQAECRIRAAGGVYRWFSARWQPLRNATGQAERWFGTFSDIDDIRQATDALRELTGQLLTAQDAERRRIARDLHDSTAQNLLGATLHIARLIGPTTSRPAEAQSALTEAQQLIEHSQRELRTVAYLLHPPMLDEAGLPSALRWYIEGFAKRSGIAVALEVAEDLTERRLGTDTEIALFRVVQEALTNIHRHSGSQTASIRLWLDESEPARPAIALEIADAGRGLLPAARGKPGIGLSSIRERIGLLGGEVEVATGRGGTRIRVSLPIKARA